MRCGGFGGAAFYAISPLRRCGNGSVTRFRDSFRWFSRADLLLSLVLDVFALLIPLECWFGRNMGLGVTDGKARLGGFIWSHDHECIIRCWRAAVFVLLLQERPSLYTPAWRTGRERNEAVAWDIIQSLRAITYLVRWCYNKNCILQTNHFQSSCDGCLDFSSTLPGAWFKTNFPTCLPPCANLSHPMQLEKKRRTYFQLTASISSSFLASSPPWSSFISRNRHRN